MGNEIASIKLLTFVFIQQKINTCKIKLKKMSYKKSNKVCKQSEWRLCTAVKDCISIFTIDLNVMSIWYFMFQHKIQFSSKCFIMKKGHAMLIICLLGNIYSYT